MHESFQVIDDPIVEEIRFFRKKHAKKFGNDIKRIVEDLREKEKNQSMLFLIQDQNCF